MTWVFVDRNECSRIACRAGLADVSTVADFILTVWTYAWLVDAAWGEHSCVSFGNERATVLAFRHSQFS